MPYYAQYAKQEFPTRQAAEAWAKEKKDELKKGELGVAKIDIDYDQSRGGKWIAKVLMPI
jgi:hypothetical protein